MSKLLTMLLASLAISANAQTNNWVNSNNQPWKNSSGQCWRNSSWSPATAHPDCDGALKPEAPAPRVSVTIPAPVVVPAPAPKPQSKPVVHKMTYSADTFFDFDKSVIKPEGKIKLDELLAKMTAINLEVIIAVGHTDYIGSDAYNMKLGMRRAQAVKTYLVMKGIDSKRVFTDSKGERQPIASNHTATGRAKNRRVEIEVVGTGK